MQKDGNMLKENRFKKQAFLFDYLSEGFVLAEMIFDQKGQPRDYRILELHTNSERRTGLNCEQILGCSEQESADKVEYRWLKIFGEVVQSRESKKFEEYSEAHGRWFEAQAYPLHIKNQFIAVFSDITERKKTEEAQLKAYFELEKKAAERTSELQKKNTLLKAETEKVKLTEKTLRESEEKYRTIFNSMDEAFCIIDIIFNSQGDPVDWRYLESNPKHEMYTRLHDVEGKLISRLAPKTEQYWFEIYGKVALTGEAVRFVATEKKRSYDLSVFKIGGQDSRKVAVLGYDITKRKRSEEKLTFQANLLSSVHDAVVAFDENGNFTYWNKMAEKVFGWSAQEVIGKSIYKFHSIKGPVRVDLPKFQKDSYYIGEIKCRCKNGAIITTDAHLKALVNDKGEDKGLVGSFRDITRRKQEEEELKLAREYLAAEVEALTKLHYLGTRFILKDNLMSIYGEILDAAIVLTRADKGSLRIFNEQNNCLEILEHSGYDKNSLNYFKSTPIEERTAGKAFQKRNRIIVEDVCRE
jgi:PAS domain S-box-containing protein